ncbi:MAG: hypothetical protein U0P30_16970 [Vicinamibacterales bacterium]
MSVEGHAAREERTEGVLEPWQIAGQRRHDAVGHFLRTTHAIAAHAGAARLVDEPSQRHRRATGLAVEPLPVPRQQRHFARDDAEARTPRAAWGRGFRLGRRGAPRLSGRHAAQHLGGAAAVVGVDLLAGGVVEDQHERRVRAIEGRLRGRDDDIEGAGRHAAGAFERGVGAGGWRGGRHTPIVSG